MRAVTTDGVEDAVEIEERDLLPVGIDGLAGIGRDLVRLGEFDVTLFARGFSIAGHRTPKWGSGGAAENRCGH